MWRPATEFTVVGALIVLAFVVYRALWFVPVLWHSETGAAFIDRPTWTSHDAAVPGSAAVHELAIACFGFIFLFDLLTGVMHGWNDAPRRRLTVYMCFVAFASCLSYYKIRCGHDPFPDAHESYSIRVSHPLFSFSKPRCVWLLPAARARCRCSMISPIARGCPRVC